MDAARIAIWGWSGGGSMTLNAIFRYPDLYKTAMAVAPVPNQRHYDTIYQERYMGLPADNAEGYRKGSPIHFAEELERQPADRPRHRRRQLPLPRRRNAHRRIDRAQQALHDDGLSQSQP